MDIYCRTQFKCNIICILCIQNPIESGSTTLEFLYIFYIQARNISAQFEERHEAKTVGEMKLFVERLPQMQVSYSIINFLCSFLSFRLAHRLSIYRTL
jgi:hypothetical protein